MATIATTGSRVCPKIEQPPFLDHPDVDAELYLAGIDQTLELLGAKFAVYLDHFPQIRDALRAMSKDDRDELFQGLAILDLNDYNRGIQNGMTVLDQIQEKQALEQEAKAKVGRPPATRLPRQESRANGAAAATAAKAARKAACG